MKPEIQAEVDRDILCYVRDMQAAAPVTAEAVTRFLTNIRNRRVTADDVVDRLAYLTDRELLKKHVAWKQGRFENYTISADGMDVLDGKLPPPNWRPA